jgi:exosome complex component RRP4
MGRAVHGTIVVPGDRLDSKVEGKHPYTLELGGARIATVVGLLSRRDDKHVFINIKGVYVPEVGHVVIGLVESIGATSWHVDINAPYEAILPAQDFLGRPFNPAVDDLARYLRPGDYIKARVTLFDKTRNPILSVQGEGLGRVVNGIVVDISPSKIARVVGKRRSMANMIEEKTRCTLFPTVNGRVHIECPSRELEVIVVMALKIVEAEAHTVGLTERIARFIEEERARRGV